MASTPPVPDVAIHALFEDGLWTLWAMPADGKPADQRQMLGSGPVGSGIMFPVAVLDTFWQGQQS